MSPAREVYTIRWVRRTHAWYCAQIGYAHRYKLSLIATLATKLRRRWKFAHVPCQLRIFGKNGRIQSERTYGHDPRRYPS